MNRGWAMYWLPSSAALCCLLTALQGSVTPHVYAAGGGIRTISGIVDEVLPGETPPVIMVKTRPGMKDEIVVGAVVRKGATIVRGKQKIGLNQVRPGERVTLAYVKDRDGLTVRSIVVHPK